MWYCILLLAVPFYFLMKSQCRFFSNRKCQVYFFWSKDFIRNHPVCQEKNNIIRRMQDAQVMMRDVIQAMMTNKAKVDIIKEFVQALDMYFHSSETGHIKKIALVGFCEGKSHDLILADMLDGLQQLV